MKVPQKGINYFAVLVLKILENMLFVKRQFKLVCYFKGTILIKVT